MIETSALPPAVLLDELAGRGLRSRWIDGGQVLSSFLAAGFVDVIMVTRLLMLIGQGIPQFGYPPNDAHLHYLETQSFGSGSYKAVIAVMK